MDFQTFIFATIYPGYIEAMYKLEIRIKTFADNDKSQRKFIR